jgi:hypothetical protein
MRKFKVFTDRMSIYDWMGQRISSFPEKGADKN